jgi:hypothetical protein
VPGVFGTLPSQADSASTPTVSATATSAPPGRPVTGAAYLARFEAMLKLPVGDGAASQRELVAGHASDMAADASALSLTGQQLDPSNRSKARKEVLPGQNRLDAQELAAVKPPAVHCAPPQARGRLASRIGVESGAGAASLRIPDPNHSVCHELSLMLTSGRDPAHAHVFHGTSNQSSAAATVVKEISANWTVPLVRYPTFSAVDAEWPLPLAAAALPVRVQRVTRAFGDSRGRLRGLIYVDRRT